METTAARRADPAALWPEALSVVVLGVNYGPAEDPLAVLAARDRGAVSVYARGRFHPVHGAVMARREPCLEAPLRLGRSRGRADAQDVETERGGPLGQRRLERRAAQPSTVA